MIIRSIKQLFDMGRVVSCPNGGFVSNRFLLKNDGMGFSLTKTIIPANRTEVWHYKNHLEACYCIYGKAILINNETRESFNIEKDVMYALDKHESHTFLSIEETALICVFNPPLSGKEVHDSERSYPLE